MRIITITMGIFLCLWSIFEDYGCIIGATLHTQEESLNIIRAKTIIALPSEKAKHVKIGKPGEIKISFACMEKWERRENGEFTKKGNVNGVLCPRYSSTILAC